MRDRGMIGPTLRLGSNWCAVALALDPGKRPRIGQRVTAGAADLPGRVDVEEWMCRTSSRVGDALCGGTGPMKVTLNPKKRPVPGTDAPYLEVSTGHEDRVAPLNPEDPADESFGELSDPVTGKEGHEPPRRPR